MSHHTKEVIIFVDFSEGLEEVLEVVDRRMTFLDRGVENCRQTLVLLNEAGP